MQGDTQNFLKLFKDFVIQTFPDNKITNNDSSLTTFGKPQEYSWERLQKLNDSGAGIFFSVNQFAMGRRKKEFLTGISAAFTESDSISIDEQLSLYAKSPLTPTAMVRSRNSIHAYWKLSDGTENNFIRIQRGLISYFHGDTAMADFCRVMRIPGFNHHKEDPFMVELLHLAPELVYSEKQLMENFPYTEPVLPPIKNETNNTVLNKDPNDIWNVLSSLDNKTILDRLSGSEMVKGEVYTFTKRTSGGLYILVNGKPADAWIDKEGFIGSNKSGGPTWIMWLMFFGHNKSDILKWAKINLIDLFPSDLMIKLTTPTVVRQDYYQAYKPKIEEKKQIAKTVLTPTKATDHIEGITNIFSSPPSQFTWGTNLLDVKLPAIEAGHYVVLFGQQGSGKTNAALYIARKNAEKISNVTFLTLEMSKEQLLKRYARDRAGVTKEMYRNRDFDPKIAGKYLPELDQLTFLGIDAGEQYTVEDIEQIIIKNDTKMLFIDNLNKIAGEGRSEFEITQNVSQALLRLTRRYKIPIILIHHANKQLSEKPHKKKDDDQEIITVEKAIKFRGISGMRGTNKTADDADIILEVARYADEFKDKFLPVPVINCSGLSVYKDREFDARSVAWIYYHQGNFYDKYPGSFSSKPPQPDPALEALATEFGGTIE